MPPSMPPVPECLTRKPHPKVLRARHLSPSTPSGRTPGCSRARHVSSVAEPREPLPGALRVGRAPRTPPGSSPSAPAREPHTERLSRALGEHATCPWERLLSSRNLENTQKIFRTLEMHHKSNIDPKNVIPIFMALYCSVLPRKNTKPGKKTKLPLGKTSVSKLCLFVYGRSLRPKFMKIYQ